jgi:CheY-like chemotaxis protein
MKCPKCDAQVPPTPDAGGFFTCPACGAKLKSKAAPKSPAPEPLPGSEPAAADAVLARSESASPLGSNPNLTLPPGNLRLPVPHPPSLLELLEEIRAVRATQEEILALLKGGAAEPSPVPDADFEAPEESAESFVPPPVRNRRRKTVLLIDDEPTSRNAAVAAMEQAEIPVRATGDGHGGIAAVAAEKPDVIVIDLGLGGTLPAKDVINMVKATMEWVDIPVVLYTGVAVGSQKEARTIHGADEYVPKGAGPEALVAKVIALFRKG